MADKKVVKEAKVVEKKSLKELEADYKTAKLSLVSGTLANPHVLRELRKKIARAKTAENQAKFEAEVSPKLGEKGEE